MFYIDTPSKKVRAFDFDVEAGAISGERVVWDTGADSSSPDGMTIDTEDRLWIAFCHGAKVVCFDPATRQTLGNVPIDGLGDLYVTTGVKAGLEEPQAGRLFVCRPGAFGLPAVAFAG